MADLTKFRELARNWEALGESDPMFGVLSDPTKHGGKWEPDEFFTSGRAHVDKLFSILRDARASFEPGRCLDFGCGVGRLTVPLSDRFQHTTGVDIARPMIDAARRYRPAGARCDFVVNRNPDLRQFATGTFDLVHSCLVLQHIPPDVSPLYIAEFLRVARPGGLVVFQLPAEVRTAEEISASHALPASAYVAAMAFAAVPVSLPPGARATVMVRVTNLSDVTWRHDIPAGRHICVGNHWLDADGTTMINHDDGRAWLPRSIAPGETVEVALPIQAPEAPGSYTLEADLVQEHICWFAQHGSHTARAAVDVAVNAPNVPDPGIAGRVGSDAVSAGEPQADAADGGAVRSGQSTGAPPRPRLVQRLLRRLRGGTPTFEMHVVPRTTVERVITANGGTLLRAVDDNAAGPGWLSYTYICRKH